MALTSPSLPSAALLLEVLDQSEEAVAVVNPQGLAVYANRALTELLGLAGDEILGRPLPVACTPGSRREIEILPQAFNRSGTARPRLVAIRSLPARPADGLTVIFFRDLSERQEFKRELRALALKDELTHLYTFRTFSRFAEHQLELASRMKKQMVLLRIRLHGLADIGSRLGARVADSALVDLAELLVKTFRKSDLLARCGEDEFAVLAVNSLGLYQTAITARLKDALAAFASREKHPYPLQIDCGSTWFDPEAPQTLDQLLAGIRLGGADLS